MDRDRLSNLGEFKILAQIVLPIANNAGGLVGADCAIIPLNDDLSFVISSDKGNVPLAWKLPDYKHDYFDMGWLTAVAGMSDLATVGAMPLCATNNILAPDNFEIESIKRFVEGFTECLTENGFKHAGGDLGQAEAFTTSSTFVGTLKPQVEPQPKMTDGKVHICVLGKTAHFIASYLKATRLGVNHLDHNQRAALLRPKIPIVEMQELFARGWLLRSTDASDGLYRAVESLSKAYHVGALIDVTRIELPQWALDEMVQHDVDPDKAKFFWGDWQQVMLVEDKNLEKVSTFCQNLEFCRIGHLNTNRSNLAIKNQKGYLDFSPIKNEAFSNQQYSISRFNDLIAKIRN